VNEAEPIRLTRAQVREIDRLAVEKYHMPSIVLMENAARVVADVAMEMLRGVVEPSVTIICGGGNNGGDGLAAARHLHNRGVYAGIAIVGATFKGDAAVNWSIAQAMGLEIAPIEDADIPLAGGVVNLVIDALFGTGLDRPPREPQWIDLMNKYDVPVLSVDVPSGLDCDTGDPFNSSVRADRTVTFVAEKIGFANPHAKEYLGQVTIGDIGCPRELIEEVVRNMR
jgi:NAD(P)H-hydrate epimerase